MIYRLDHDLSHITESGVYDATLVSFLGDEEARFDNPEIDYSARVPDRLQFVGDLATLASTDYPYLDRTLPLVSPRLLLALLTAGEFRYRLFPTRIYDLSVSDFDEVPAHLPGTQTNAGVTVPYTDQFVLMQLLDWTNVVDYDRTVVAEYNDDLEKYEPRRASELDSIYLGADDIERLVLTVGEEDLPGVFTAEGLTGLYCSEKTKRACQAAGIVGVEFTPIPVPRRNRRIAEEELAAAGS